MKYTQSILKLVVALCLVIAMLALTFTTKLQPAQPAAEQTGGGMALQPPAFLKSAYAADSTQVDFSFLLDEAGVTAYTKLDQPLDLTLLESDFKTIGRQTDQFISGIVIAPGYEKLPEFGENAEIQVFLQHDGWILAYLTKWQVASVMFDWVNYDEKRLKSNTLIENMVRKFAEEVGVSDIDVAYYDFRNPQASNLMLVADHVDDIKSQELFEINIPRELTIYESSWLFAQFWDGHGSSRGACYLAPANSQLLTSSLGDSKWTLATGELVKVKFPQGVNNGLSIQGYGDRSYCGLAIVYREAAK